MSVQQTQDCGYIISGYAYTDDLFLGSEVYLLKTPVIVQEFHDGAVIALDSPGDTVLPDSTYPVKAINLVDNTALDHIVAAALFVECQEPAAEPFLWRCRQYTGGPGNSL